MHIYTAFRSHAKWLEERLPNGPTCALAIVSSSQMAQFQLTKEMTIRLATPAMMPVW